MMKNFDFWAFFFGPLRYLYRKMYILGSALTAALAVLSNVENIFPKSDTLSRGIILVIWLILYIILGFTFKDSYISHCVNVVTDIKKNSIGKDPLEECRKKGGTNLLIAIIVYIAVFLVAHIATSILIAVL